MNYFYSKHRVRYVILSVILLLILITFTTLYVGAHYAGRALTEQEKALARSVYANDIDLSRVHLVFDSAYCVFAPISLANTIHVNTAWSHLDSTTDLTASPSGHHVLIHELAHVSQYQHGGWSYLAKSIFAQTGALLRSGSRNEAYRWEERLKDGTPWENWNPEEQAQGIADYEYYEMARNGIGAEKAVIAKELGCIIPILKSKYCETR